ncbi:hypothetical protein [Candidatus Stoquefichus massiliensis]|uniref:hypothetical protein n=1 Tax=Candidatus Stoquefichus massiliensis TaxID=1470350 RepID=UPI000481B8F7|nr:hypothetical protein [Candidatus Stoquefichus massiliensis]
MNIKWNRYLIMAIISFFAFMLEYFSIFVIEKMILHVDIWNYTANQRSLHCLIMVVLWGIVIVSLLTYTYHQYHFPHQNEQLKRMSYQDYMIIGLCLILCKVMTFIDWHTLKVIGELQGKSLYQFFAQYMYYIFEVGLVCLIIIYGQKAIETLLKKETEIPFGGFLLAFTWGVFHFVSRGQGIEIWNGISCMFFSVLSGIMYLKVKRKIGWSYILIAIGYLL